MNLVLDLDGTLLHPQVAGIEIRGMSGSVYMSTTTAKLLVAISSRFPLILATGRNARSVAWLVNQLEKVQFYGFVLENGLVARKQLKPPGRYRDLPLLLPNWKRLKGYEACLGLLAPQNCKEPLKKIKTALSQADFNYHLYHDSVRNKFFIYSCLPSKLTGLQALKINPFIVIGDADNDVDMLRAARYPFTLSSAFQAVRQIVHHKKGYISPFHGHDASEDMLTKAWELLT